MTATTAWAEETNGGTVTSWLPLPTVFTANSACWTKYRLEGTRLVAFDPAYGNVDETSVICGPRAVTLWWETPGIDGTVISLGPLTCPDSWATVATSIRSSSSTNVMCCPSGYYLASGTPGKVGGDCVALVQHTTLTYASSSRDGAAIRFSTTTVSGTSTIGAIAIMGWNVQLAPATRTASSSITSTTPASRSISTATEPTATSTPSATSTFTSTGTSGLSSGAAAGVGIGVALGTIGIAALLTTLCIIRRRKRKKNGAANGSHDLGREAETSQNGGFSTGVYQNSHGVTSELAANSRASELETKVPWSEPGTDNPPAELDNGHRFGSGRRLLH